MKKIFTLFGILFFFTTTINSQIIHVPADQPSIQAGIEAASDGDTVLVDNGTYLENINFTGKAITVASNFIIDNDTNHISNTIIDGSEPDDPGLGSVVTFYSGEDTTSILTGFTITGGTGTHFIDGPIEARAGGAIFIDRSGAKLTYNYIVENEVNYTGLALGGGITAGGLTDPLPWLILRSNKIMNNSSVSTFFEAHGGGLEIYFNLIMTDNDIINNEAIGATISVGGGLNIRNGFGPLEINITNNLISQNKSVSDNMLTEYAEAGGMFIALGCAGIVNNNMITSNMVEAPNDKNCYAAGVFIGRNSTDLFFENNFIMNNAVTKGNCIGGGVLVYDGGASVLNNVIQNNTATWGGGISVWNNNSDSLAILMNNTITGNESAYGGGLYMLNAEAVLINSILWDNEASEEGSEIFDLDSELEVRHSNVEGGWPGNGNMDVNPMFRSDGYHLDVWSTLLNEGTSSILIDGEWYDCPEYDIDGQERPFSFEAEIGADEATWNYVGIKDPIINDLSLRIYPNPASSIVNFSIETDHLLKQNELIIYNTLGETILSINFENPDFIIKIDQIPAGIYIVKCKVENQVIMKKLIISR